MDSWNLRLTQSQQTKYWNVMLTNFTKLQFVMFLFVNTTTCLQLKIAFVVESYAENVHYV